MSLCRSLDLLGFGLSSFCRNRRISKKGYGFKQEARITPSISSKLPRRTFIALLMGGRSLIRGKVVLVPFPFDDLSSTKVRPAVCLTEPVGAHRHIVLAFISSRVPVDILKTDILIDAAESDFRETGLRVSSVLSLHRLMTVTTLFVQRELGELPARIRKEVDQRLKILFELL